MKRGFGVFVLLSFILILSLTFVSAMSLNDIFGKITGKVSDDTNINYILDDSNPGSFTNNPVDSSDSSSSSGDASNPASSSDLSDSKGAVGSSCLVGLDCTSGQCDGAVAGACSGTYNLKVNWLGSPFDWAGWVSSVPCEDCHDAGQVGYFVKEQSWYGYTCVKNFLCIGGSHWSEGRTFVHYAYATTNCNAFSSQSTCTPTGCSWTGTSGVCKAATTPAIVCGDGKKEGTETCDDGNVVSGDGCSLTCVLETGYTCTTATPNVCTHTVKCGDGKKEGTETCDDGNVVSGDGCSLTCVLETGYTCTTATPNVCTHISTCTGLNTESCLITNGIGVRSRTCNSGTWSSWSSCAFGECNLGYANCDSSTANGCEVKLGENVHCASCTNVCVSGQTCQSGVCKAASTTKCTSGQSCTNEVCSCDDSKECTTDTCSSSGTCKYENKIIANPCTDDGKSYTIDVCFNGECLHTPSACATDNNECTKDYFSTSGVCTHTNEETGKPCKTDNTECMNYICSSGACIVHSAKSNCVVTPAIACGNGIKEGTEACDDKNLASGDGCSSSCVVETGWACTSTIMPNVCIRITTLKENGATCSSGSECTSGNCSNTKCSAQCIPVTNPCESFNCGTVANGTCADVTCGICPDSTPNCVSNKCSAAPCVPKSPLYTFAGVCGDKNCGTAKNGTCADVTCGTCLNSHGTTSCPSGSCVPVCSSGYADCDSNTANGCEIQLGTTAHCASCTNVCTTGQSCVNNICKSPEDNSIKRIAFRAEKVNQHTENGVWTADPDGISDINVDKLTYCKKFYPSTISVRTYQVEQINTWKSPGSTGAPNSASVQSYECVQSNSAATTSCELGCSLSNGRCVQVGYRQSVKYCSPNGDFVNQIVDDAVCDNNFECTSNFCVERKCISGTLIQKILSWFSDLFRPR